MCSRPGCGQAFQPRRSGGRRQEYCRPGGRGGWTWYTGSAGWMPRFDITFRYHGSRYAITVENPSGVSRGISTVKIDGVAQPRGPASLALVDDP